MGIMDTREKVVQDSVSSLTDEFYIMYCLSNNNKHSITDIGYVVKQTLNIEDIKTHSRKTYIVFENK